MEPLLHTLFVVAIYFIERTVMPFRSLHRTHTNHRREEPRSMPHSIPTSVTILYHQLVSVDLKWIQYWTSLNRLHAITIANKSNAQLPIKPHRALLAVHD
eukprot:227329_1